MPVLRHTRLEEYSPLALPAGIANLKDSPSLSPMYMTPNSEFSGSLGPMRPPGGAFGSPAGAPGSRRVVVANSGRISPLGPVAAGSLGVAPGLPSAEPWIVL